MKSLLRSLITTGVTFYLLTLFLPGVNITDGFKGLAITTAIFILLTRLIKPFLSLFLLPINLLTANAFRWLINVALLIFLSWLSPYFTIKSFIFTLPAPLFTPTTLHLSSFWATVITSFFFQIIHSSLRWLIH
ncbi:MAG: phage holin family protein [Candidatus Chisholmbacteria bacterium]|nr:phage holin family protein [Candidatus Chisholmbacteria bacterium]